jgi:hypothetical protein
MKKLLALIIMLAVVASATAQKRVMDTIVFIKGGRLYKILLYTDRLVLNDTTYYAFPGFGTDHTHSAFGDHIHSGYASKDSLLWTDNGNGKQSSKKDTVIVNVIKPTGRIQFDNTGNSVLSYDPGAGASLFTDFLQDGFNHIILGTPSSPYFDIYSHHYATGKYVSITGNASTPAIVSTVSGTSLASVLRQDETSFYPETSTTLGALAHPWHGIYGNVIYATGGTSTNWNSKEPGLGNPGVTGQVLSSTTGGARSWVTLPIAPAALWESDGFTIHNKDSLPVRISASITSIDETLLQIDGRFGGIYTSASDGVGLVATGGNGHHGIETNSIYCSGGITTLGAITASGGNSDNWNTVYNMLSPGDTAGQLAYWDQAAAKWKKVHSNGMLWDADYKTLRVFGGFNRISDSFYFNENQLYFSGESYVGTKTNNNINFVIQGQTKWTFGSTGVLYPSNNNSYDFASAAAKARNGYFGSTVYGNVFNSAVATGTAPLTVASTTTVTNLSADLLDGQHGSYYAPASLTAIPGTDHTTSGTLISLTATANSAIGDVIYIASTGKATFCKADAIANCPYCLAICADATISANAAGNWLTHGSIRDDTWNWTVGAPVYVSTTGTTGNTLTQTITSGANNCIVIVGVALSADVIHFESTYTVVEHL